MPTERPIGTGGTATKTVTRSRARAEDMDGPSTCNSQLAEELVIGVGGEIACVDSIGGGGRDRTVDLGVMNPTL